jgi:hypothetical protein
VLTFVEGFSRARNRISCGQGASRNSKERSAIDSEVAAGNDSGTRISDTKTDGYAHGARDKELPCKKGAAG